MIGSCVRQMCCTVLCDRAAAGKIGIRAPQLAGMIHILAAGARQDVNLFSNGKSNRRLGDAENTKERRSACGLCFSRTKNAATIMPASNDDRRAHQPVQAGSAAIRLATCRLVSRISGAGNHRLR